MHIPDYLAEFWEFSQEVSFQNQIWLQNPGFPQIKICAITSISRYFTECSSAVKLLAAHKTAGVWLFFAKALFKNRVLLWTTMVIKSKSVNALQRIEAQPAINLFHLTLVSSSMPSKHKTSYYRSFTKISKASCLPLHWEWQVFFSSLASFFIVLEEVRSYLMEF